MTIQLGRSVTSVAEASMRREWLVTNGIGGYAMGALNMARSRRYHGILVAAQVPPTERQLLLASVDAWIEQDGHRVPIMTHEWATGVVLPDGYRNLETFYLDGSLPVWHWTHGNIKIVQRVWMPYGQNTTYVTYSYVRGDAPLTLTLKPLISHRDHHATTKGGASVQINPVQWALGQGIDILPGEDLSRTANAAAPGPFRLLYTGGTYKNEGNWWWSFHLSAEAQRGLTDKEDIFQAGQLDCVMQPGDTIALIATLEDSDPALWQKSLAAEQKRQADLIQVAEVDHAPDWIKQLVLAADQFIVNRKIDQQMGKSVIAGYPWFSDWGRDTMISLPGLTLATHRYDVAASILRTFAKYVDQGMLPNRFPDEGGAPEYNTVDATLWYFVAIYRYLQAQPQDTALRDELYPILLEIVDWHRKGTRYGIQVDPTDHLLRQGDEKTQLTWMDVKVDEEAITPRNGKPVEINALWYNALRIMGWLAAQRGEKDSFSAEAEKVLASFRERFWFADKGYCYDVIDTPTGHDSSLRPNQLMAVSLPFPLLEGEQAKQVVDSCARSLVGSYGLRTLAPDHDSYKGRYAGDAKGRDRVYHQGTMWAWLLGPFVSAHFRVYQDADKALGYVQPIADHLLDAGLGTISEIFDGDAPHHPHGCIAQAWSVAEVLRCYREIEPHVKAGIGH